jgi:phospholipase/lecithinase/hemolysin
MSRQTVSTKNVNTLINFAKSYADSTESMRGYKLTFSDIIEQEYQQKLEQVYNQIINGAEIEVYPRMYKDLALMLENYTVKEVIYGIDKRYRIKIK